jgi:tripartite ATP-independent transporter DctP family solute receptor
LKKFLSLLLALGMMASLAACGGNTSSTPSASTASTPATASQADSNSAPTAPTDEVFELKFAHHQQPDSPAGLGAQRLADRLNEKSNGRLKVTVYPAEQLGTEKSVFEQLNEGVVDMSTLGFGIIGTMSPSALAMEMGYMFQDYNHLSAFLDSDVFTTEIVNPAIEKAGVRIGGAYYNGVRHTTTSSKPVTDPASMAGVKLRVPSSDMLLATFEAMGASPTPMAFSEVYMALQNNTIDGQENPIPTIMSMKFYEVQKYLCLTGHMVQAATFVVSEKSFQKLPPDLQELMLAEMKDEARVTSEDVQAKETEQLGELQELGMEVVETDKQAFIDTMPPVIERFEQQWGVGLYDKIQATNPNK